MTKQNDALVSVAIETATDAMAALDIVTKERDNYQAALEKAEQQLDYGQIAAALEIIRTALKRAE